jgi:hypothetical protein
MAKRTGEKTHKAEPAGFVAMIVIPSAPPVRLGPRDLTVEVRDTLIKLRDPRSRRDPSLRSG